MECHTLLTIPLASVLFTRDGLTTQATPHQPDQPSHAKTPDRPLPPPNDTEPTPRYTSPRQAKTPPGD